MAASREAARIYHSAAALEPSAYGLAGVSGEPVARVVSLLRRRGVTASAAASLEKDARACVSEVVGDACRRTSSGGE